MSNLERREALILKMASKTGLRGKINAKCCECIYDGSNAGTWRKQVQEGTSMACPLYTVRPTSEYKEKNEQNEVKS